MFTKSQFLQNRVWMSYTAKSDDRAVELHTSLYVTLVTVRSTGLHQQSFHEPGPGGLILNLEMNKYFSE